MLVHNTIYKIIYKFFKMFLLFYHFLCNLCLSHVAATLRNAYSFQVISILFLTFSEDGEMIEMTLSSRHGTKISLVWCKKVARALHEVNHEKKYNKCVFV